MTRHKCLANLSASALGPGSLRFISNTGFTDNRVGYTNGERVFLEFNVGHVNDDMATYATPTVTWLRDGLPVVDITPSNTPRSNGGLRTTISFGFLESLAGVYQCIFADPSRSEVLIPEPIGVDTGEELCTSCCTFLLLFL